MSRRVRVRSFLGAHRPHLPTGVREFIRVHKLNSRFVFVVGLALAIGLLYGFNYIVQQNAKSVSRKAAIAASKKVARAEHKATVLAAKVERRATARALEIGYHNQLASCNRGIGLRLQVRANAIAVSKAHHVLYGFFEGARKRALAQSVDPNLSAASQAAARKSIESIDAGVVAFSLPVKIPPLPIPCLKAIRDPNGPPSPP